MNEIIVTGCARPKHAPPSPDEVVQNAMHQANGQQECLQRVCPAYVWWRINPAVKPHPTAKAAPLAHDRTKLDAKGHSLPGGLKQVNRTVSN